MSKVTVVGAGNVGATCVNAMAIRETAGEIVLLDIKEGLAEGKVLDMYQTSTLMDFDTNLLGVTNDYAKTAGSDVVVITSGMPRKPGMSREDLIGVNAGIVKDVVTNILKYSPDAILLIVSNPMDTMTTLAQKVSGLPTNRVFGMGGALDSARSWAVELMKLLYEGRGLITAEELGWPPPSYDVFKDLMTSRRESLQDLLGLRLTPHLPF